MTDFTVTVQPENQSTALVQEIGNSLSILRDTHSTVSVQQTDTNLAVSQLYNPVTVPRLEDIGNIDASSVINGSVLVYKTHTGRWTSTTTLDAQNMEGGEF
jgi:hypothetical protein